VAYYLKINPVEKERTHEGERKKDTENYSGIAKIRYQG
jgi:hypothetical protein